MNKAKLNEITVKAFRKECRNIVGKQKGGTITRMVKTTGVQCDWEVDESVDTACWSFGANAKGDPRHLIKCGLKLNKICNSSTRLSDAKLKRFTEAVIRHETEHGLNSDRTSAVPTACRDNSVPFRLWNLFEDCRIEAISATRKNGDGAFRWINFQDVDAKYNKAVSMLWAIKINEAWIKKSPSSAVPTWTGAEKLMYQGKFKKTRLIVLDFYRRACSASTSMDLVPICMEWIKIFGVDVHTEGSDEINGERDPNAPMGEDDNEDMGDYDHDAGHEHHKAKKDWCVSDDRKINESQVQRIARSLKQVIQSARSVPNQIGMNGTGISAKHIMQGSEKVFKRRGRAKGCRSLTLIVDMSGSMCSTWQTHGGAEFVLAFRELARKKMIDLTLLLTQDYLGAKSYRVKPSDSDEWINSLRPDGGGERIMQCMKRFDRQIKASTTSVIFTDSKLRDSDIDLNYYRQQGLNVISSYIESNEYRLAQGRRRMNKHFARSVIATEANELARRLMREILKD
jgi:hypothetical protein